MSIDTLDEWMTAAEAGRYLGVSRPRVHQLIRERKADRDTYTKRAGCLFISRDTVEEWARKRKRGDRWVPANIEELRFKRGEILKSAHAHGITRVMVFGSIAKGNADDSSDLDLLVDVEDGRTVLDIAEFIADVEDATGRTVDLSRTRPASAFAQRVSTETVPL